MFFWVCDVLLMLTSVVFALPMFKLIQIQAVNFITGKTTNERFSRQYKAKRPNPFHGAQGYNMSSEDVNDNSMPDSEEESLGET